MASGRENSNFSPSVPHYESFGSRGVQGEFGSNVPDYGLCSVPDYVPQSMVPAVDPSSVNKIDAIK